MGHPRSYVCFVCSLHSVLIGSWTRGGAVLGSLTAGTRRADLIRNLNYNPRRCPCQTFEVTASRKLLFMTLDMPDEGTRAEDDNSDSEERVIQVLCESGARPGVYGLLV